MSNVPIVQGMAVNPNDKAPTTVYQAAPNYQQDVNPMTVPINAGYGSGQEGQQLGMHAKQPNQFRDSIWAVLFILHFIPLGFYAYTSATSSEEQQEGGGPSLDITPHLFWISITALVAVGLSTFSLEGMMRNAAAIIKFSLFFSVGLSGLLGVFALMSGQIFMGVLLLVSFAIGICYAFAVLKRIPYAAANLRTGLTAVRLNMGLILIAYVFMALGLAWTILFFVGFGNSLNQASYPVLFCWLLSYYWVHQVLEYAVHVITAGVIATWWFSPLEAASFFSSALQDSMIRALSYSFGSICFGAFVVAFIRALRMTLNQARQNDDAQFLVCIIECILACIENIVDYFNQWALVYVGIYGFSYLDAGREVITLFREKGWTVVISDNLVERVVLTMSVGIGLVGGLVGYFMGQNALSNAGVEETGMVAFGYGFLIAFLFASIALGIVGSAVNTVIVLFCEAPAEFQANHPELSNEMRAAFHGEYPELVLN